MYSSYDEIKEEVLAYFTPTSASTKNGKQRCTGEEHASWLFELVKDTSENDWICEIGVLYGHLTAVMGLAALGSNRRIVAVDHMIGNYCMPMENRPKCIYGDFIEAMKHFKVWDYIVPFPMKSHGQLNIKLEHEAATFSTKAIGYNHFQAFDMLKAMDVKFGLIYLDGDHSYKNVLQELKLYTQLLKPGGYIAGDDCEAFNRPFFETFTGNVEEMEGQNVAKAVVEFFYDNDEFMPIDVPNNQFGFIKL